MIKHLSLVNFQGHRASSFKFHPGVNVIVGQSDSGKTSIIRALKWLATNRPSGDSFKRHGKDAVKVTVQTEEDTIVRFRNKSRNTYRMNGGERFAAVGTGVPEDILKALNLSDINWQLQHDPPFLISESAGDVAKKLNDIAGLSIIDRCFSNLASEKRENDSQIRDLEETVAETRKEVKETAKIVDAGEVLFHASELAKKLDNVNEQHITLTGLLGCLKEVDLVIGASTELVEALPLVKEAYEKCREWNKACVALNSLNRQEYCLEAVTKDIHQIKADINVREKRLQHEIPEECPLCGAPKDWVNQ